MAYGLPYMGSKNKIAEEIVRLLPKADNLYDLFCGGCAITHCALLQNKYKNYYINDIQPKQAQFFVDCLNGKYKDEKRWIDRETFFKEFKNDPFISCVWSFGNKGYEYIYGKDIEVLAKALHYAIAFNDYSLLKNLGYDIPNYKYIEDINTRRLAVSKAVKRINKSKDSTLQHFTNLNRAINLERVNRLNIKAPNYNYNIYPSCDSYENIEIKDNSVIYCDIPYESTADYISTKENKFDYNKFYNWALSQKELVVISSYNISDNRFIEVYSIDKYQTLSRNNNSKIVQEKLYIPYTQLDIWNKYNKVFKQTTLFDLD